MGKKRRKSEKLNALKRLIIGVVELAIFSVERVRSMLRYGRYNR